MRKLLKLQEHKHTAKKLAHHHTSYRGLWVVMAVFGLSLLFIQMAARAESYTVTAKIPAPMPSDPPIITIITTDNNSAQTPTQTPTVVDTPNITISGDCPIIIPSIIVGLYRQDQLVSSSGCSDEGKFSAVVHLVEGTNVFVPKIITITGDVGPAGPPINLTLVLGSSTTNPSQSRTLQAGTRASTPTGFSVYTSSPFITYKLNQNIEWQFNIEGGTAPYSIKINWGDGSTTKTTQDTPGVVKIKHLYKQNKTYLVKLTVQDKLNETVSISVAAVTLEANKIPSVFGATQSMQTASYLTNLKSLVVIYLAIALVIAAFWYGSRRELRIIAKNSKRSSRR